MKIEFIKRGAATRLILIFAGWSTDARYYNDCVADGWDTAVVSDYRDLSMPPLPRQYATVYVFAYSLGVAAASLCGLSAAVRVAVCGSPLPVSDSYGIPEAVYSGTLDGLDEKSLMKFHLRMAGDRSTFESIRQRLPEDPDIALLKEELASVRDSVQEHEVDTGCRFFDRVYLAERDRIFPYSNLKAYWNENGAAEVVTLMASHAVDLASVVRDCLPDTASIGEGFARAVGSYNENAVIQKEICLRMCDRIGGMLHGADAAVMSLLEIGAGSGMLTDGWRRMIRPRKATYVDLMDLPEFGAAAEERYIRADAEAWLEASGERFDIILSASTIQWFADPVRFVSTVRRHLNPGGFAVISTFVKGNLKELDAVRPAPIIYRTKEEYEKSGNMKTESWERVLRFDSAKEMLMHLRLTGVSPHRNTRNMHVKKVESPAAVKLTGLSNSLTYRPLILILKADDSLR